MKRSIDSVYDQNEQLSEFKSTIRKESSKIIEKELGKIISRNLDDEKIKTYLSQQFEMDRTNGDILKSMIESVEHVSATQLFSDIKTLSERLWDQLKIQRDQRFYIVLTGSRVEKSKGNLCIQKSNMFLAILSLSYNENLLEYFEDFVCVQKPLYSDMLSEGVTNFLYIDDASFSGRQMSSVMTSLAQTLETTYPNSKPNFHFMVLYMSSAARDKVFDFRDTYVTGGTYVYTTETRPTQLEDTLLSLSWGGGRIDKDTVKSASKAFTRDYPGDYDTMDKSLFYTDLKIADTVSIYSHFLLDPVLVDSDFKTYEIDYSIVNNCGVPVEGGRMDDFHDIENGTFCPKSTYKEKDWQEYVSDMFPSFFK